MSCCTIDEGAAWQRAGAGALEERLGARKAVPAVALTRDLESGAADETVGKATASSP